MRKTDKIRFYILKTLKDYPNIHGYQLYLIFKKKNMVKNPSQLYKILRSMKRKGHIFSREEESNKGPNKKILHITEKGETAYYTEVLDHIKIIADLIGESMYKVKKQDLKINMLQKKIAGLKNKKIYLDLRKIPNIVRRNILVNNVLPAIKENNLKVYADKFKENLVFPMDSIIKDHLVFLDENMGLKENSIDLVLTSTHIITKRFLEEYTRAKQVLKQDGELILGFVDLRGRSKGILHPQQTFHNIFKLLESELPPEYEDLFFKEVNRFKDIGGRKVEVFSFTDLIEKVRSDFKNVKLLETEGPFNVIIASGKMA